MILNAVEEFLPAFSKFGRVLEEEVGASPGADENVVKCRFEVTELLFPPVLFVLGGFDVLLSCVLIGETAEPRKEIYAFQPLRCAVVGDEVEPVGDFLSHRLTAAILGGELADIVDDKHYLLSGERHIAEHSALPVDGTGPVLEVEVRNLAELAELFLDDCLVLFF